MISLKTICNNTQLIHNFKIKNKNIFSQYLVNSENQ